MCLHLFSLLEGNSYKRNHLFLTSHSTQCQWSDKHSRKAIKYFEKADDSNKTAKICENCGKMLKWSQIYLSILTETENKVKWLL